MTQELAPVRIEITEDATAGISIRLHNNGRFPDLLRGIPKRIVSRAQPWMWTSYERRVLAKARTLSWQGRKLVRQLLIAERAKALMAREAQPMRAGWLTRRVAARAAAREGAARVANVLPRHRVIAEVRERLPQGRVVQPRLPQSREAKVSPSSRSTPTVAGHREAASMSLVEQMVLASWDVAEAQQQQNREEPERDREAAVIRPTEGWAVKRESELTLVEQMISTSAWTGLRAQPLNREEGQERSR